MSWDFESAGPDLHSGLNGQGFAIQRMELEGQIPTIEALYKLMRIPVAMEAKLRLVLSSMFVVSSLTGWV